MDNDTLEELKSLNELTDSLGHTEKPEKTSDEVEPYMVAGG